MLRPLGSKKSHQVGRSDSELADVGIQRKQVEPHRAEESDRRRLVPIESSLIKGSLTVISDRLQ